MNKAKINKKTYSVPGSWEELSTADKNKILEIKFSNTKDTLKSVLVVIRLLKLNRRPFLKWFIWRNFGLDDFTDLTPLAAFVFEKHHLPLLKYRNYHAPKLGVSNLTFSEFVVIESQNQDKEGDYLYRIAAALYRPKRFWLVRWLEGAGLREKDFDDDRVSFSDFTHLERYQEFKKHMPIWLVMAINAWYQQEVNQLKQKYTTTVFSKSSSAKSKPKALPYSWSKALMDLASSADRIKVVGNQPLGNILFQLHRQIEKQQELEEQLESRKHDA